MDVPTPIIQGNFFKLSGGRKNVWQRRFLRVYSTEIRYYKNARDGFNKHKGFIPLAGAEVGEYTRILYSLAFYVKVPESVPDRRGRLGRSYVFRNTKQDIVAEWMEVLRRQIAFASGRPFQTNVTVPASISVDARGSTAFVTYDLSGGSNGNPNNPHNGGHGVGIAATTGNHTTHVLSTPGVVPMMVPVPGPAVGYPAPQQPYPGQQSYLPQQSYSSPPPAQNPYAHMHAPPPAPMGANPYGAPQYGQNTQPPPPQKQQQYQQQPPSSSPTSYNPAFNPGGSNPNSAAPYGYPNPASSSSSAYAPGYTEPSGAPPKSVDAPAPQLAAEHRPSSVVYTAPPVHTGHSSAAYPYGVMAPVPIVPPPVVGAFPVYPTMGPEVVIVEEPSVSAAVVAAVVAGEMVAFGTDLIADEFVEETIIDGSDVTVVEEDVYF